MDISVVTPAHNEEAIIARCIESVREATTWAHSHGFPLEVEHIVVLNRCTDRTEAIALNAGCRIVQEPAKNLSAIRNAGARVAQGRILITIDADSWMEQRMLVEVTKKIDSGRFIGGGVRVHPERLSLGIFCSVLVVIPFLVWHRVFSAGMFWVLKSDFDAIDGFDESLICVEDVDFAKRLRKYGKAQAKRYGTVSKSKITTSCRKFDQFGDWIFVRNPKMVWDIFHRRSATADEFYYDVRSDKTLDS